MAAFDYARPLAVANRIIDRFGQLGAVRRAGAPSGSPFDPTPGANVDHPARFVVLEFEAKDIDGTRVLATDKKVLLAPGSLTISPTDDDQLVEADGTVYSIVNVMPLRPAETTLLWTIQARR